MTNSANVPPPDVSRIFPQASDIRTGASFRLCVAQNARVSIWWVRLDLHMQPDYTTIHLD